MSTFMKFLGIYLSEGDYRKTNYDVNIYQKKENISNMIEDMLMELDLKYTINVSKNGKKTFRICDPRLNKYVSELGNCYTKFIPIDIKNQSKDNLRILFKKNRLFYDQNNNSIKLDNASLNLVNHIKDVWYNNNMINSLPYKGFKKPVL